MVYSSNEQFLIGIVAIILGIFFIYINKNLAKAKIEASNRYWSVLGGKRTNFFTMFKRELKILYIIFGIFMIIVGLALILFSIGIIPE